MTLCKNYITACSLVSFLIITISCSQENVTGKNVGVARRSETKEISFSLDSLSLELDSVTVNIIHYCQYIPDFRGRSCLSFLNENTNSIYFYDFQTKSLLHKIDLSDLEIQKSLQGYLYSDDRVYTYSYSDASLTCIDCNSKQILFSCRLYNNYFDPQKPFFTPKPFPLTCMPIKSIGNTIVLSGMVAGESMLENSKNRPVITLFDLYTKEISHVINYPSIYQEANWGGGLSFRSAYYDINKKEEIVVSFPAYDEIVSYSMRKGIEQHHHAGSSKVKKIRPFTNKRNVFGDSEKLWEWYLKTSSYENILYDEYRHLYYRFVKLPQNSAYNPKVGTQKPTIIIVLDESYSYVGELLLPNNMIFVTSNSFVSRMGICIQKREKNEDLISFYIIRPII